MVAEFVVVAEAQGGDALKPASCEPTISAESGAQKRALSCRWAIAGKRAATYRGPSLQAWPRRLLTPHSIFWVSQKVVARACCEAVARSLKGSTCLLIRKYPDPGKLVRCPAT
jgi:hypothetical protein